MSDSFQPIWPLPGISYGNITGHFGDMYDNGPHNGLDIGADYGTPIVAAQAGQVISAEYHWSWGNNVLIWHNQDYSTRYAHCSSLAVTPGQYVEQGQTIGYVGNTGYSFGYHLHFEVYYGGSRVNRILIWEFIEMKRDVPQNSASAARLFVVYQSRIINSRMYLMV